MRIGNLTVSKTNIKAISSASTIHIGYLLGMKVRVSARTHEEQLIGKRLTNMKQCGSASQLNTKYSVSLDSKLH